jgi:hypothetical protein
MIFFLDLTSSVPSTHLPPFLLAGVFLRCLAGPLHGAVKVFMTQRLHADRANVPLTSCAMNVGEKGMCPL